MQRGPVRRTRRQSFVKKERSPTPTTPERNEDDDVLSDQTLNPGVGFRGKPTEDQKAEWAKDHETTINLWKQRMVSPGKCCDPDTFKNFDQQVPDATVHEIRHYWREARERCKREISTPPKREIVHPHRPNVRASDKSFSSLDREGITHGYINDEVCFLSYVFFSKL